MKKTLKRYLGTNKKNPTILELASAFEFSNSTKEFEMRYWQSPGAIGDLKSFWELTVTAKRIPIKDIKRRKDL